MVEVAMIFTGLKGKSQQLQNCRSICHNISVYISIRSKWKKLRKNNLECSNIKPHKTLDKSSENLQRGQLFNFVSSIHGICWTFHFSQLYRDHWQYQSRNCSGFKSAGSPWFPLSNPWRPASAAMPEPRWTCSCSKGPFRINARLVKTK